MAETINQASVMDAVNAIPSDQVKSPTQPVDVFVQEAENLLQWCSSDKEKLVSKGLNPLFFDSMPFSLSICREAQAKWVSEQKIKSDAAKAWQEQSPEAFALRDQLVADFRYAFRTNPDLMKSVALIAEGSSNSDMIQDLADLSELGKKHPDLLALINFETIQLDTAATLSKTLAVVLAQSNGEKNSENATLLFRNKAYTSLKTDVDEIRTCGKYVFRLDKNRKKGYRSNYEHKKFLKLISSKKEAKAAVNKA